MFYNQYKKYVPRYSGFTLSEVLITLAIIGIVAALTIPTLLTNFQNQQYKVGWKKTFSVFSRAVNTFAIDRNLDLTGVFTSADFTVDTLKPYFNCMKLCYNNASVGNCWANTTAYLDGTVKTDIGDKATMLLVDGTSIYIYGANSACNTSGTICLDVFVDINGPNKGPNRFGKDMYALHVTKTGTVVPFGANGDTFSSSYCEGSTGWNSGLGCSAEYLMQ